MGDFATQFRLIAASALVGLLIYCGCHVVQVWRKRNAQPAGPSAARRLAWVCLFAGFVLIPMAFVLQELTHTEGVLTGEDLFVVRASDDMAVEWLQDQDEVVAGQLLVRFGSGSRTAKAEELRARLARTESERDVLALLPLTPDPELTRRHQGVSVERAQVQQELGQAVAAAEIADRNIAAQVLAKKEALARLERILTERRKDLERATIRSNYCREMMALYAELRARGTVTAVEYQEKQKSRRDADVEVASLAQELKDGLAEKALLLGHVDVLEADRTNPAAPLQAQVSALRTRLTRLQAEEKDLKGKLDQDLARSSKLREAEKAQADAKVREQRAGLVGLAGEQEARAPCAGRIAYRAASPNATRPRGPLLVLGPLNGYLLTARLPRAQAEALRDVGDAVIEMGDDSPERRIPARFHKAESLAHEPDHAALQLECQPPPEVVRRLADGEKLTVAFAWRPPLAAMWPFRAGILLAAVGLIGLILTQRTAAVRREALVLWDGQQSWTGPKVNGIETREHKSVRDVQAGSEPMAALVGGHPQRRATDRVGLDDADLSGPLIALEASCLAALERLNRAECPEEAAQLLAQLHRIRRALRALDAPPVGLGHHEGDGRSVPGAGS